MNNLLKNNQRYRKTIKGVITNLYHKMKERKGELPFTLGEFYTWCGLQYRFARLYLEWELSGYPKELKPSVDRINCKKGYTFDNMQVMTWAENRFKQTMERRCRKGAVLRMLGDKVVKEYKSQREAVKETGLNQGNMSLALNGKRNFCGGYKWRYTDKHLLK